MAKVYSGKVMIPAEQMDEYFAMREAIAEARQPFRESLEALSQEFEAALAAKYAKKTIRKHINIIELFIIFICDYTDVEAIEEITKGMVNSHFRRWYKKKVWDSSSDNDLRVALKKFFQFLDQDKGITNQTAPKALK